MPLSKPSPNLAPEQSFEELALLSKLTIFFKTWGRLIIFISQSLVLASFLWMCFLDVALSNLNKTLTTKIATVKAQTITKQKLASIQKQLLLYNEVKADKSSTTDKLSALEAATPNEVTLQRISLAKNGLDLSAEIRSGTAFGKFLLELKNKSVFKEISLKNANWDDKNQYFIASLTISL